MGRDPLGAGRSSVKKAVRGGAVIEDSFEIPPLRWRSETDRGVRLCSGVLEDTEARPLKSSPL